jgi:hypothetical protein
MIFSWAAETGLGVGVVADQGRASCGQPGSVQAFSRKASSYKAFLPTPVIARAPGGWPG